MESILFLGIIVCMISCILAQMIKVLCILQDCTGALSKCQEFIQLSLQQSLRNIVCSKGCQKFIPGDNMPCRLHGIEIVPPDPSSTSELLGGKGSFA
jgi:hypothetical protein